MKQIIVLFALLIFISGCERKLDSSELGIGPPVELPVPVALKIFHLSDGIDLTWQISDTGSVSYFKIYYSTAGNEEFLLWDTTSNFSLAITTLNSGISYEFRVSAVDSANLESDFSSTISTQVGVTSVIINANQMFTNNRNVSLTFAYPVLPILVQISEDPSFNDAVWRNFSQPGSYIMSDGDGTKHIYVQFRFGDGSESMEPVSDSIILDTRAFIDSVYFKAGSPTSVAGDTVLFYLDASETGGAASISFSGLNNLALFDNGGNGDVTAGDGIYSRRYIIPINLEIQDGIITGSFTDAAGNNAESSTSSARINIVIPADPIAIQVVAESSSEIRLNWSEVPNDNSNSFTDYRIYRSFNSPVTEASDLVTNISSRSTLSFTDDNLNDNQIYWYRIFAYGVKGLINSSEESSATTLVNTPPNAVTLGVGLIDSLRINISWTENNDDDFESYQIYRGSSANVTDLTGQRLTAVSSQGQTSYTDVRFSSLEIYYYVIYVYDRQGLKSAKSNVESTP